jgi:predicted NAD/FAD-dependent oxidoreductase
MAQLDCIIIGAGLAGLTAGNRLSEEGKSVIILDKGRGVGGRMATRRIGGGRADHGAQFFTVRDDNFKKMVDGWLEAGAAKLWSHGFPSPQDESVGQDGHPRYCGSNGMTAIPKLLAANCDVRTSMKVEQVSTTDGGWLVVANSEDKQNPGKHEFTATSVLFTAPAEQSLALCDAGNVSLTESDRSILESIVYEPCFAVMAVLEKPSNLPDEGALKFFDGPIVWIADNNKKGISPDTHVVTIHASPAFTRDHYDEDKNKVGEMLIEDAMEYLGSKPSTFQVHRWRYSLSTHLYNQPFLAANTTSPLLFAGDGFECARVEGAALSGLKAADHLLKI